jgi:hypothetical protein
MVRFPGRQMGFLPGPGPQKCSRGSAIACISLALSVCAFLWGDKCPEGADFAVRTAAGGARSAA